MSLLCTRSRPATLTISRCDRDCFSSSVLIVALWSLFKFLSCHWDLILLAWLDIGVVDIFLLLWLSCLPLATVLRRHLRCLLNTILTVLVMRQRIVIESLSLKYRWFSTWLLQHLFIVSHVEWPSRLILLTYWLSNRTLVTLLLLELAYLTLGLSELKLGLL